ncbi:MAG: alanine racemase [Thomasclavelia sp.]|jgi:alanine racemase|nr:alanine racemase [Thomasclavelia sp.]
MSLKRDTYAVVDLKKLKYNVEKVHSEFNKPLMAVIKANAYGHGYKEVASYLNDLDYIKMYAVATLPEAIKLRENNINKGILILGAVPTSKEEIDLAIKYDITLTMVSLEYMHVLEKLIDDKPLKVHIKLDTGMHRIGLTSKEEFEELLKTIDKNKFVVEGVFTHFATADGDEKEYQKQYNKFYDIVGDHKFKYIHCCNSAAMHYHHDDKSNLGRIGITMYGCDPAGNENNDFKQVMSLYTKVVLVKKIHKGDKIGYGLTYKASEDEFIATLPIGYADGFIRANQGRKVYINGKYYEIVGRVCMDQMMVRVDESIKVGDKVEIFGDHISLESMAKDLNTISYEILCLISDRVERIYLK